MDKYHKIQTVFKRDPATNHKTLLENEYSLPEFCYLKENDWVFTEKVDGTNVRVMWTGEEIKFAGKTDNAQMPMPLIEALGELFSSQVEKFHDIFGGWDTEPEGEMEDVCLYGEGYGGKIQKGGKYNPTQTFVLFDVFIGGLWLRRGDVEDIATKLGCNVVPVIGHGPLSVMVEKCRAGFQSQWGQFEAEGIVARPMAELRTRRGDRMITKLKCRDFA